MDNTYISESTINQAIEHKLALSKELERIEEDSAYSGKSHHNADDRWACYHLWLGIPSVILSTLAGTAFFQEYEVTAGLMSTSAGILAALMTFLRPSERAALHKSAGDRYFALKNNARLCREIRLPFTSNHTSAIKDLEKIVEELIDRRNDLNQLSPACSRSDFEKTRKGISEGEATYEVDKGEKTA
jgi:hypothetical protein